jgi:hypothetical protein
MLSGMARVIAACAVALLAACAPSSTVINTNGDGGSPDGGGSASDGGAPFDAGCSAGARLVYVIDVNNTFSSFQPGPSPVFTDLGTLNCPAQVGATPFSMSVDRSAAAWVLYSSGELFKVDTQTVSCSTTTYAMNQQGIDVFGMGFVADAPNAAQDTLYIAGNNELGTIDTQTLTLSTFGLLAGQPELTGTGDAKLYGFYPDPNLPRVSQIDKSNGLEGSSYSLSPQLQGNPHEFAFAFWGGDFWIFLQRYTTDASTNVWHLAPATGAVTEALSNTGRNIVGAGVSTCAPITLQ